MDELTSPRDFEENRHSLAEILRRENSKAKIRPNYINSVQSVLVCKTVPHHNPEKRSAPFVLCTTNTFYRSSDPDTFLMRLNKEGRYQATDALQSLLLEKYQQYEKISKHAEVVSTVADNILGPRIITLTRRSSQISSLSSAAQ